MRRLLSNIQDYKKVNVFSRVHYILFHLKVLPHKQMNKFQMQLH